MIDCIDRMIPKESDQLLIHNQITIFNKATCTFSKNLARIARESDKQGKQRISIFKFIFYYFVKFFII